MTEHRNESKKSVSIPCTLVRDLLPLYIERLTAEDSDRLLREHLTACEDCRKQEALLRNSMDAALTDQRQEEKEEINYLKKIRRSGRRKLLFGFFAALALLAVLLGAGLKLYVFGYDANYELDKFFIQQMSDSTTAYTVHIQGHLTDEIYCRYELKTDSEGNDNLKIYARLPLPWEDDEDVEEGSSFDFHLNSSEIKGSLTTPFYYIGPNFSVLTTYDRQLFEAKNPYVGDMPANMKLADLLITGAEFGTFESELETDEKPYIWTLQFTEPMDGQRVDVFERSMPQKACLLLALIDNLDEVRWTYIEKTDDGNIQRQGSMDIEEATFYNGVYIKDCADSPYDIDLLRGRLTEAAYGGRSTNVTN